MNTGALLNRLNYAVALAGNHMRGSEIELPPLLGADAGSDPYQALDRAVSDLPRRAGFRHHALDAGEGNVRPARPERAA